MGVLKVARVVNEAKCVWRETLMRDVGIDGQIEHVLATGEVTGRIVAVQVKTGDAYFVRMTQAGLPYTIEEAHADYWVAYPLPVILVFHQPSTDLTLWADARTALRGGTRNITIRLEQVLDPAGVLNALAADGPLPQQVVPARELIEQLISFETNDPWFDLSYFDLFCYGLTDIAWSVYIGMDLAFDIAEAKAHGKGYGVEIGYSANNFLDRYIGFLIAYDLARIDYQAWRDMAQERQMVGQLIAPLTRRGRELVETISRLDVELLGQIQGYHAVAQESAIGVVGPSPVRRIGRIEQFKERFRNL